MIDMAWYLRHIGLMLWALMVLLPVESVLREQPDTVALAAGDTASAYQEQACYDVPQWPSLAEVELPAACFATQIFSASRVMLRLLTGKFVVQAKAVALRLSDSFFALHRHREAHPNGSFPYFGSASSYFVYALRHILI